ncbi:hypothetical protein A374_08054 [Fictibacillus macauensis ZFHKF-1]|uniref:Uncharacterized protein n=1 Tax=Fictibacillus macauensis ZFHKF-1 TaxID=1196324 RepID=I8AJ12_9BACL|nr:hypothetical protein [Fictibacillus macauensis]EIT85772.1 hypothetical protein A374_08054 [Fictibacillus macauensis ZFHKF-1]
MDHGTYQPPHYENRAAGDMHEKCKKHMHFHVIIVMHDGSKVEGIITHMDHENVHMLMPQDMHDDQQSAQHNMQGMQPSMQGAPMMQGQGMNMQNMEESRAPGNDDRYWYGRWGYRRFYPGVFPLAGVAGVSLYPYYRPYYPYPYPPYPYY